VVLALVNHKGGVGKTTTAVNLAAVAGDRGSRTLLIDLDSQASASLSVGVPRRRFAPSVADALLYGMPVARVVRRGALHGVDLITGAIELANTDLVLADVPGRERCLRNLIAPLRPSYDLIFIDTPPGVSLLSVNAIVACDAFIVPVTPQFLAVEAVATLLERLDKLRRRFGVRPRLLGMVLTMMDRHGRAAAGMADFLRTKYKDDVFHTEIDLNRWTAEAPAHGRPVVTHVPSSACSDAYRRLAAEVFERLGALPSNSRRKTLLISKV
jgi:chromosome partitioning protein